MKLKLNLLLLVFLLVVVCVFAVITSTHFLNKQTNLSPNISRPVSYDVFTSSLGGFSIKHPETWNAIETPQGSTGNEDVIAAFLIPGRSFPQLYVARHSFISDNIDAVVEWGERQIEKRAAYTIISFSAVVTPNLEGASRDYKWQGQTLFGKYSIRCRDIYFINERIGFDLSFCAEEKQWDSIEPVFLEMINSFKFVSEN